MSGISVFFFGSQTKQPTTQETTLTRRNSVENGLHCKYIYSPMGNYTCSPVILTSGMSVVDQRVRLHPENAAHRLDPSHENSFTIDAARAPSFVKGIEPNQGSISLEEDGRRGDILFRLILHPDKLPDVSQSFPEAIKITVRLLILPVEDIRGTPCVLSNTITVPIQYLSTSPTTEGSNNSVTQQSTTSLPDIDLTCRFN